MSDDRDKLKFNDQAQRLVETIDGAVGRAAMRAAARQQGLELDDSARLPEMTFTLPDDAFPPPPPPPPPRLIKSPGLPWMWVIVVGSGVLHLLTVGYLIGQALCQ